MILQHIQLLRLLLLCFLAVVLLLLSSAAWSSSSSDEPQQQQDDDDNRRLIRKSYGVDVSFPMHHSTVSTNYAWLPHNLDASSSLPIPPQYQGMPVNPLGDTQAAYERFLKGCFEFNGGGGGGGGNKQCVESEQGRIDMALRQPRSMKNYTETGFQKIKAPAELFEMISDFWEKNKDKKTKEAWSKTSTYTNHWEAPTEMVAVDNQKLRGGGYVLKQHIWDVTRDIVEEWTQQSLTECSLYGIRVYPTGSILATHVDRLPLVSSAIINVASDVDDEPWPLEVIGHDGRASNITMEPGDMILYESHSVLHGRPFPLKGRFVANLFVHFEPTTGHSLRHRGVVVNEQQVGRKHRKKALERGHQQGGHEHDKELPDYILEGSEQEQAWKRQHWHPNGRKQKPRRHSLKTGGTDFAHQAASEGDVKALEEVLNFDQSAANARDANGWTPIHEAARGGHLEAVQVLVKHGASVNAKTSHGGSTALYWAKKTHGEEHPVIEFLESLGAIADGPEL